MLFDLLIAASGNYTSGPKDSHGLNIFSVLQNMKHGGASYQPGATVLTFEEELSPDEPTAMQALLWRPADIEGSSNSEGSHETGDSGRYSHDETEMTNLSSGPSSRPPSLMGEDSGGSDSRGPDDESPTEVKVENSRQEVQDISAPPGLVCGSAPECVWDSPSLCFERVYVSACLWLCPKATNLYTSASEAKKNKKEVISSFFNLLIAFGFC